MDDRTARRLLEDERERLRASRQGLVDELADVQEEGGGHSGLLNQPADQVTRMNAREEDESLIAHLDTALGEVDAALQRIADGTYGRCEVDGEPIPDERLEALPATRYCVRHEQDQEQLGRAARGPQ
jgi:RNA polymerase-binding transcription factor DksA